MTTVAFKDGIMASESCQSHAYIDPVECRKIYVVNGDVIGLAGNLTDFQKFLKWYKDERSNHEDIEGSSHQIESLEALVYSNGKLYCYDESCIAIRMGEIGAVGSGSSFAVAAMLAGASVEKAVDVACQLDPFSNGPIYTIDVKKAQNGNAKRPRKITPTRKAKRAKTSEGPVLLPKATKR